MTARTTEARAAISAARVAVGRPPTAETVAEMADHARRHAAHAARWPGLTETACHAAAAAGLALAALAHRGLAATEARRA